jgi:hypothetical protein
MAAGDRTASGAAGEVKLRSQASASRRPDRTAAEKLINQCGYHRRDEELEGAKRAIPGP